MEFTHTTAFSDCLQNEWRSLFDTGITKVPFLRPEYLKTWWQTRGGGEWPEEAELLLICAREGDQLVGIAPCFISEMAGKRLLLLLGSIEISDYLDLLVRPQHLDEFAEGLLGYIKNTLAPAFKLSGFDLYNVLEQSPSLAALQQAAQVNGLPCEISPLTRAPYIQLSGDYEEYLSRLDKKQRHEIRRKMRRMLELPTPSGWYIANDANKLDAEIEDFLTLMAYDPEKQAFLTPKMKEQMRLSMKEAFQAGILQLAFFTIGDEKAAAYFNFDFGNRIYVYNSGINPAFFEHSPGWVLLAHLLKWSNENGRFEFDFMRGTEDYKYKFGALDRQVIHIQIGL